MNMHNKLFFDVLSVINAKGTVIPLLRMGYQYLSIFEIFEQLQKETMIEEAEEDLWKLTEKGKECLAGLRKENGKRGVQINTFDQYRIEKIGIDDVFLP